MKFQKNPKISSKHYIAVITDKQLNTIEANEKIFEVKAEKEKVSDRKEFKRTKMASLDQTIQ